MQIATIVLSALLVFTSLCSPANAQQGYAIESVIDGEFEGWEDGKIIRLMNGQIWEQTEIYYWYYYAYMPRVIVFNSGYGWKMIVEGVDKAVGVQRLK